MDWITNFLSSAAGGGLFGVIGSGLTLWAEQAKQKALFEHQREMRKIDIHELKLEADKAINIAKVEAVKSVEVAASEALSKSFSNDRRAYHSSGESAWFVLVDVLRGIIRPSLTFYSALLMTWLAFKVYALLNLTPAILDTQTLFMLFQDLVNGIVFVCSTVILWWFGSRPRSPKLF